MTLNSKRRWTSPLNLARNAIGVLLIIMVSACGGGGGDSNAPTVGTPQATDNSMRINFDSSSVRMAYDEGDLSVPGALISASTQGTPSGRVFIGATTPSGQPDPNINNVSVVVTGTTARVTVNPKTGLASGVYSGTLLLQACRDEACAVHYAGSPWPVSYTLTVMRALQVSPNSISISAETGTTVLRTVTVSLPTGVLSYTVFSDSTWLSVEQITPSGFLARVVAGSSGTLNGKLTLQGGTLTKTLSVVAVVTPTRLSISTTAVALTVPSGSTTGTDIQVTLPEGATSFATSGAAPWLGITQTPTGFRMAFAPLPGGSYVASVLVSSLGQTAVVNVNHTVVAPLGGDRRFGVGLRSVTLASSEGGTSQVAQLGLVRPSWHPQVTATFSYPSGSANGWLTQATQPNGDMGVSASAVNLPRGVYSASILLTPAYPDPPQILPVMLTVGPGMAAPSPQGFIATSETSLSQLAGTIPLIFNGVAQATWRAESSVPWLMLTQASGSVGQPVGFQINPAALSMTPTFTTQTAVITLRAETDKGLSLTPAQTSVTFRLQLAEIDFAAPAPILSGRVQNLILRGRGFSAPNTASRLEITGVKPNAVTVVNDTQLTIALPTMNVGTYKVGVSNALGIPSLAAQIHVIAPSARAYSSLDTSQLGNPRTLQYDAIRGDLYASYPSYSFGGLSAVARFRPNGTGWTVTTLAIPGLFDIALAPDGSLLAATDSSNKVNLIDLSSFTIKNSYVSTDGINGQGGFAEVGIAFTNDGKLWLSRGSGGFSEIGYFDTVTRTFGKPSSSCTFCYGGPYFAVSRDGSRLMVGPSLSITPLPDALYVDAADGVLRSPIGLKSFIQGSLSDSANRFMANTRTVYDGAFGKVGDVPLINFSGLRATKLSPDGRRAYVLNYPFELNGSVTVTALDTSSVAGRQVNLPIVTSFSIPDAPGCYLDPDNTNCIRPKMLVTPDGNSLLLLGDRKLIVVPIPPAISGLATGNAPVQWFKTLVER